MATTNATATTATAIIRFTMVNRRTRETAACWLASASFADGPGMRVKRMSTTRDRSKAARFSVASAHEIAVQFSQYPASLERPDGSPLADETTVLRAEQTRRHAEVRRIDAEINAMFAEGLRYAAGLVAGVRK